MTQPYGERVCTIISVCSVLNLHRLIRVKASIDMKKLSCIATSTVMQSQLFMLFDDTNPEDIHRGAVNHCV